MAFRYAVIAILLSLAGCTNFNKYIRYEDNRILKQCAQSAFFSVDESIPGVLKKRVISGFEHWNEATGHTFYYYVGTTDYKNIAFSTVYYESFEQPIYGGRKCGRVGLFISNNQCIQGAHISVDPYCVMSYDVFETLIRHIAGNVLGLKNQVAPGTLMHYTTNRGAQHPVDANDDEINAVMHLYGLQ